MTNSYMTFKKLKERFKFYEFEVQGKPLEEKVIPYTFLPKGKSLEQCEVVDYEVIDKETTVKVFGSNFKYKGNYVSKGIVRVYVK